MTKIGLLFDERLNHDRKRVFHRNMSVLKVKYALEFLPPGLEEDAFIELVKKESLTTVLIPWHFYFAWKKAANLSTTRVLGYFADPLLHFEFQAIPNYQNFALLDFYRLNMDEVEILFKFLTAASEDTEMVEAFGKTAHYMTKDWFPMDHDNSTCIDQIFDNPILKSPNFSEKLPNLRLYITALWLSCFREKAPLVSSEEPTAKFMLAEFNKRLLIQISYTSPSLTSKEVMMELWPTGEHSSVIFRELALHSDFLKIYHFPKTRKISITGLFLPNQLSMAHSGEVRGFWVENRL